MEDWNKKLFEAAEKGRVEELKLCLANGANIDYQEDRGLTALMWAAWRGHVEVCRLLLENKCNKDITDDRGWTALMWAANEGHVEVCQLLLENKCNKDITDVTGWTALMKAAMWGHVEVCRLLLENKCNKDITSISGWTALMSAAARGHVEVSRLLLENKCNKDITEWRDGKTALHLAAEYGELHVTRYLVEEGGISPFVKTHEGKTPYDLAAATKLGQYKEVMEYLQTAVLRMKESSMFGRGSYESFDMRCMVTGQFGVGKSSLVKLLVGDNVPEGRHATNGISLVEGRCGLDIETRSWIMIDPATYNALDVVYNKVLMTSIEEDESQGQTKTPEKQESVAKPGDSQNKEDTNSQKSDASKSPYFPANLSDEPSSQPQAAQSVSPQTSSSEYKKQQMKKKIKTKMTKKEIRKRMEKVLKTGKYKMKVGRLIFWDFGGQYVYYTTHQTFMTYRALFLVVFDGSKGLNEEIPDVLCFPGQHMTPTPAVFLLHWVNSILTYCKVVFAGIPKILFVATHKDKVPVEDVETRRALLYSEVEELFKDHEGRNHLVLDKQIFVNATDKDDQEVEALKKAITELTFDHPCWGENMPNACIPLELEIAEMVAAGKQILSLVELEELNSISKVSVLDLEQLHDFLHFQHSLGKIIYFDTCQLRDYVIINPLFMVEVMRSFVTDKGFWPKKRRMQVIFSRMSESGIIRREDLYQIWEQKDFRPILRYKEFIFDILIHLDILADQRRYDTATGSRLPVENFFVPCMVTQRNTTSFMNTECTPKKAICLAFVFKGTVIPPALPNRLISACLSMWTLKHYEGRKLLFSGFVVVSFDKAHDICVCIEGNKVLLYIVHRTSAGLIVPDIATGVKECLVTTMERISDFYQSTINVKHSQQLPFHIEYSCSELKCFICEEEALHSMTSEWVCDKHKIRHRAGNWVVWNQYKKKEQCEQNCSGLSDDALSKIPSDIELLRFSTKYPLNEMFELVTYLEMCEEWEAIKYNNGDRIEVAKFLVLTKWKQMKAGSNFQALAEALTTMNISKHLLCQVRRVRVAETDIPSEYMDYIPTDEILDALASQIGQIFFQLGAELGLSIANLENIQSNNSQDLVAQNKEVLFKWREDRTVKPTIRVLVQALVNVGRGSLCLQEVLKTVDLKTLRNSDEVREKGAIMKKRKNKSKQKPHIPAEIELMADKRSVPLYLKLLESGYENKRDIRLVIVGQKGAGKTSLIKRLLNEGKTRAGLTSFLKRFIGRNNAEVNSTNGIEIHTIKCNPNSCDGIWNKLDGNYEENALYTRLLKPFEEKLVSGDKAKIEAAGNKTISEPTTTTTVCKQSEKLKPSVDTEYKQKTLEDSQVKQSEVSHKTGKENTLITNLNRRVDESNESETITQQPEKIKSPEDTEDDPPADTESHAKLPVAIEFHATNVGANVSQLQTEPPEGIVSQCKPQVTDSYHYQQQNLSLEKEKAYKAIKTMMEKSNFDLHDKDEYATFLLWDFAGDEEFYHTHQTFLSPDAIYLVVTKLDEAENKNAQDMFQLWMNSIHCYCTLEEQKHKAERSNTEMDENTEPGNTNILGPPVILIGSHKDKVQCSKEGKIENACRDHLDRFVDGISEDACGHIRKEYFISNTEDDDKVFRQMRQDIINLAKTMSIWNKRYPLKFIQMEKCLQEKKKELQIPIMSLREIQHISTKMPKPLNEDELRLFLEFHHEIRALVYFKDLPDFIILDTQWLSDAFKCIVTAEKFRKDVSRHRMKGKLKDLNVRGILHSDVLEGIFKDENNILYKQDQHKDDILNIMEKFDIIIPAPRESLDEKDYYYVPCMVKSKPEKDIYEMFNVTNDNCKKSTWLCFKFMFLPPHLINHLIASLSRKFKIAELDATEQKKGQIALFRGTVVFELHKSTKLRKLILMTCPNFIQIQILEFKKEIKRGMYKDIAAFVTEEIIKIISRRFKMSNVKFDKKWKCGLKKPESVTGLNDFSEKQIIKYHCEKCQATHKFTDEWSDLQNESLCITKEEFNFTKMGMIVLNILADVLYDLLKQYRPNLPPRSDCDITYLYSEHRKLNKHIPSNSSHRRCPPGPWGGTWLDIQNTDIAIGDDIERIRLTRNELQHSKTFNLDDNRFSDLCNIIGHLLKRFDKNIKPVSRYTDRLNETLAKTCSEEEVISFENDLLTWN